MGIMDESCFDVYLKFEKMSHGIKTTLSRLEGSGDHRTGHWCHEPAINPYVGTSVEYQWIQWQIISDLVISENVQVI